MIRNTRNIIQRYHSLTLKSNLSLKEPISHASTPHSKMESDLRYKPVNTVPKSLLEDKDIIHSPGFSIKGEAKVGRPAYLDFQATTPLDPRVLDAMVNKILFYLIILSFFLFDNLNYSFLI